MDEVENKQSLDEKYVQALKKHRQAMYRVAFMMLKSPADAEDAVSMATVNTYRAIGRIHAWDAIKAYLMRVTVNACHDILRKRKREAVADVDVLLATQQTAPATTPIWMYTQQLPMPLRMVIQLRYGEDLSLKEIGQILRIPKGTVSSRLSRAQAMLRELIEKEGL